MCSRDFPGTSSGDARLVEGRTSLFQRDSGRAGYAYWRGDCANFGETLHAVSCDEG